jgi:FkbM family methyltransferase
MPNLKQSLLAILTRCYPLYSGGIRFTNHPLIQKLGGTGVELVWARVKGGKVLCNLNDLVGRTAFYSGDLDRKISWVCSRIVKPGDTVLDIGANVGIVSLWLARLVGRQGKVHAFEPNPELLRLLNQTLERNRVGNICVHPVALGPNPGEMQLRVLANNTGSGSLILHHDQKNCAVVPVPVATLDSIVVREEVKAIRLVKIDVEGFEAEVFHGATHVLNSIRPQAILFEFIGSRAGALSDQPVFKILHAAGYAFFAIPKCRFKMYLERFDPGHANHQGFTDFLAVQQNDGFKEIAAAVGAKM